MKLVSTKTLTPKALLKMAEDLEEKLNKSVCIEASRTLYGEPYIEYRLFITSVPVQYYKYDSWQDLLNKYQELMVEDQELRTSG